MKKKKVIHPLSDKVIAYVRVSTDQQDTNKQKLEILDYAQRNKLTISEFITIEISSRKTAKERRIEELLSKLKPGDTLIISELSRLGRSTTEVIGLVNGLVEHHIRLIAIKQNINMKGPQDATSKVMITVFSMMAELERDTVSQRTKAALKTITDSGRKLGRPKGILGKSKLDGKEKLIQVLMGKNISKSAIARLLDVSRQGLLKFMKSRKIVTHKSVKIHTTQKSEILHTTTMEEIMAAYKAESGKDS